MEANGKENKEKWGVGMGEAATAIWKPWETPGVQLLNALLALLQRERGKVTSWPSPFPFVLLFLGSCVLLPALSSPHTLF